MSGETRSFIEEIPIALVQPVRCSADTPPGVLFSYRPSDPLVLTFAWKGEPQIMHLEGSNAFEYASIEPRFPVRGVVVADLEFLVDVTSRYNSAQESDPRGALILTGGKLSIIAGRAGDRFGDDHEVPLWGTFNEGTKEESVGFARWSIAVRDGDRRRTIWARSPQQAA